MLIAGREVNLVLDLGAMKKFKEVTGKNFFSIGAEIDPELLGALISVTAERGGTKLSEEEIDKLTVRELGELQKGLLGGIEGGETPPKVSRRK
jgi:hypothetical protein